jgi:DNA helicase-2/ATP-dependent DNA helicase PcrA
MTWSDNLSDEQRVAAGAQPGHVVLLAGPGTGKTYALIRRIQYLIDDLAVPPEDIQALTFSRAAAAEMRERLVEELGDVGKQVKVATLHSYSLRQLMRHGARRLPAPLRVAGDWEERWIVVEELSRLLGRRVKDISNGRDGALDLLADDWETLAADGSQWEEGHPDAQFLTAWHQHRNVYGYTLRSELVYQLLVELRSDPALQPGALREIVVDEYQDLNRCDLKTVGLLAARAQAHVFAAGDDDQSIYSFRHALPAGIRQFEEDYPGAMKLVLRECRRCGEDIVTIANWLISQELDREPKELVSVTDWPATVHLVRFPNQQSEAAGVARAIQVEIASGTSPHEILILVKSDARNHISSAIRESLEEYDIEVYLPRAARIDSVDVQRVLEYLILSSALASGNQVDDLALRALLELEENRIGERRLWTVTSLALERSIRFSVAIETLRQDPETSAGLMAVVLAADQIVERARGLAQSGKETFDEWLTRVGDELRLDAETFESLLLTSREVSADVLDLEIADDRDTDFGADPAARRAFDYVNALLDAMSNLSDAAPPQLEGRVTFTTMHGAKGLTADTVFVLQAEDEVIPGEADGLYLDEARRLLYVSLTRARTTLVIAACRRRLGPQRFVGQQVVENRTLTRFLADYEIVAQTITEYLANR